jgi:hypothetical protein
MDMRSQRGAEDLLRSAVEQLLDAPDPITGVRQIEEFIAVAMPYLWAARRAAIYRAKTSPPIPWTQLAQVLDKREANVRDAVRRHCDDTGDAWPRPGRSSAPRPTRVIDLRKPAGRGDAPLT